MEQYNTPEEAITALEIAYTQKDLKKIFELKDFFSEAELVLEQTQNVVNNELIEEVAELLRLSLIKDLQENGFPDFNDAKTKFSEIEYHKKNIWFLTEEIYYPDGTAFENKIYVSEIDGNWKVVSVQD